MTAGVGQPTVMDSSSSSETEEKLRERPRKRRRQRCLSQLVRTESVSTGDQDSSDFSTEVSNHDTSVDELDNSVTVEPEQSWMPRPTNEVPVFWRNHSTGTGGDARADLAKLVNSGGTRGSSIITLGRLKESEEKSLDSPVLNVRVVRTETSEPRRVPRGIETLDLHSLIDLHAHLEAERESMPGELVVPGKVSGLAVGMLIDSGASVSVLSTALWDNLHRVDPRWTLLSTDCCVRTVSGARASVRGRLVLEVEFAGQFYVHQFIVMDIQEDIILGLDFVHKYDVDCDWKRGVLRLKGTEVQACRRYTLGDGNDRRLVAIRQTVVPAGTQVVVEAAITEDCLGGLPDWGLTSSAQKSVEKYGVMAGAALVDPRNSLIPVPVINPGDTDVVLPRHSLLGYLEPVCHVTPHGGAMQTTSPMEEVVEVTRGCTEDPKVSQCTSDSSGSVEEAGWSQARRDQFFHKNWSDSTKSDSDGLASPKSAKSSDEPLAPPVDRAGPQNVSRQGPSTAAGFTCHGRRTPAAAGPAAAGMAGATAGTVPQEGSSAERPASHSGDQSATPEKDGKQSNQSPVPPHLAKLYNDSIAELPEEHHSTLATFLCKYQDVWATSSNDLGHSNVVQHRIETEGHSPIKQPPRRVPIHKKKIVQEEIDKMLDRGVIEPADGPWASPIVLVTKKDGTTRFCVDFRRLNDVTKKDAYPLPRIEDNLDTLQGAVYYSTLDLISGFWQVEVAPEHRDKTAFSVGGGGLYRFLTMPFGLCNAPATFQRLMEHVLKGLQWEIAVLYIDDVIVFADTFGEHLHRLGLVLDRLRQAGLKLKPEKCELFRLRVEFLGHIVSTQGVEVDPSKIDKVLEWPEPRNLTELRSFVGLCAYYRRFVPDFSTICKPLYVLTQKGQRFVWGEAQQQAMDTMKSLLTKAPVLGYPRTDHPFILDTDASNVGIGAVLSQVQEGEERVIAYSSRTLSAAERNYCVTRREMLAIVRFVRQFHHYLYGGHFLVRTDHAALYWLLRKKEPEGQMARWVTFLQSYDMQVQHRQGVKHGNADALSRCMEGCRDLDTLQVPVGTRATLEQIQVRAQAQECVARVQTRAQAKVEKEQIKKYPTIEPKQRTEIQAGKDQDTDSESPDSDLEQHRGGNPDTDSESPDSDLEQHRGGDPEPAASRGASPHRLGEPVEKEEATLKTESRRDDHPELTASRGASPHQLGKPVGQKEATPKTMSKRGDSPVLQAFEQGKPPVDGHNAGIAQTQRMEQFYKEQLPDTWSDEAMSYLQQVDSDIQKVRAWCKKGQRPSWDDVAKENFVVKTWWGRYEQLLLSDNGVLYIRWESVRPLEPPKHRVVAVSSMFNSILRELHDVKTAGHQGQKRTMERAKKSPFYWPGMVNFARRWVQSCTVCMARKHPQYSKRTPLLTYRVGSTMDRVSIDLVGPFHPATKRGNTIILTVTDQFTRWLECFPLRRATAPEIARRVVEFVCRLGMPLEIHSDQGKNVDGEVMREVCKLLGIRKTHTTAYRPQGNSITERANSVLKKALSSFVNLRATDWDDHISAVGMAMRSAVNRTLNETPNAMMLGRQARLPIDLLVGRPAEIEYEEMPSSEYAAALAEAMKDAQDVVSQHVGGQIAYQKKNYDRNVKPQTLSVGQAVWLRMFPHLKGRSKSLVPPWDGTWIIVARLSQVNLKIQKVQGGYAQVVHSDRLKPFHSEVTDPGTKRLQDQVLAAQAKAQAKAQAAAP